MDPDPRARLTHARHPSTEHSGGNTGKLRFLPESPSCQPHSHRVGSLEGLQVIWSIPLPPSQLGPGVAPRPPTALVPWIRPGRVMLGSWGRLSTGMQTLPQPGGSSVLFASGALFHSISCQLFLLPAPSHGCGSPWSLQKATEPPRGRKASPWSPLLLAEAGWPCTPVARRAFRLMEGTPSLGGQLPVEAEGETRSGRPACSCPRKESLFLDKFHQEASSEFSDSPSVP